MQLVDFYKENSAQLGLVRKKMKVKGMRYPQMKLLDMGFWQIGYERMNKDCTLGEMHG